MARLIDLPIDILLIIVAQSLGKSRPPFRRAATTNLALVCKRLYGICGYTLFHTYNLITSCAPAEQGAFCAKTAHHRLWSNTRSTQRRAAG
ncbi:hypothetical protein DENSPDRAFT_842280 [Dentipellis sp. KUC8613]|nr:hypothetical protein DENSPDRAFT_842280 [Dentipellis sp. KUC8613]